MSAGARAAVVAVVGIATFAAGCGDNLRPVTDGVRSGDRLAATFWVGGGARLFAGFFDRELGLRCRFELLPDDERAVCVPAAASAEATAFLDDRCTTPLVRATVTPSGERPRVARVEADVCEPPAFWALGEAIEVPQFYTRTSYGACAWRAASPGEPWYPGARHLPIDELVGGRVRVEDRGQTLHLRYVDGDDGSRQPIGVYDARMGAPCAFTDQLFDGDAALACYPDLCALELDRRLDRACRPVLFSVAQGPGWPVSCACAARRFALIAASAPPLRAPEIREIGSELPEPVELFAENGDTCEYTGYVSSPAWRTGDAVAPIAGRRAVLEGTGRLRPLAIVADDDGTEVLEPWLRDREVAIECQPRLARDGVRRCLPSGLTQLADSFFADDACTHPARVAYAVDFDGSTRWAIVDDIDGRRAVYQVTGELLPGNLYRRFAEVCAPHSWSVPFERFFVVGPEAAPERFAVMTELVE